MSAHAERVRAARRALDELAASSCDCPYESERELAQEIEVAEKIVRALLDQLDPDAPYDQGEAITAADAWLRRGSSGA